MSFGPCIGKQSNLANLHANGWLRDRLQGTRRRNGNGWHIHRIEETGISAFLKRHAQEINLGKVDQIWFLDLVLLRGREVPEAKTSRAEISGENSIAA